MGRMWHKTTPHPQGHWQKVKCNQHHSEFGSLIPFSPNDNRYTKYASHLCWSKQCLVNDYLSFDFWCNISSCVLTLFHMSADTHCLPCTRLNIYHYIYFFSCTAQTTGLSVEYAVCISAERVKIPSPMSVLNMTLNHLNVVTPSLPLLSDSLWPGVLGFQLWVN